MNVKAIITEEIKQYINENVYDEIISLDNWYKEERDKLDKIQDYKTWKLKSDILFKQFLNKKNELTKQPNAFGLSGDLNANFIYHYTNGDSLINIIEDNILIGGGDEYGGISFTSHPNLYKRGFIFWHPSEYSKGKHHGNVGVKMKFDFNKMKADGLKFKKGSERMGTHAGEDELRLLDDELENPLKYLVEIILFKDKENDYLNLSNILNAKNIRYKIV